MLYDKVKSQDSAIRKYNDMKMNQKWNIKRANWHSTYPKKGEDYFILFRSGGETIAGVRLAMDKKGSYCKVTVLWDGEEVNIHRTIMKELKGRMLNASEI